MRVVIGGVLASPGVMFLVVMFLDLINGVHLNPSMIIVSLFVCLWGWRFAKGCYDAFFGLRFLVALVCLCGIGLLVTLLANDAELPVDVPFLHGAIGMIFAGVIVLCSASIFWMLGSTRETLGFEKRSKHR